MTTKTMNEQKLIKQKEEISLCNKCYCMTKTIKGKFPRCGKCGEFK